MAEETKFLKFLGKVGTVGSAISAVQTVAGFFTPDPIDELSDKIDTRLDDIDAQLGTLQDSIAEFSASVSNQLSSVEETILDIYYADTKQEIARAFSEVFTTQDRLVDYNEGLIDGRQVIEQADMALNAVMAEFAVTPEEIPLDLGMFMLEAVTLAVATRIQVAMEVDDGALGKGSIDRGVDFAITALENIKAGVDAGIEETISVSYRNQTTYFVEGTYDIYGPSMANAITELTGNTFLLTTIQDRMNASSSANGSITTSELLNYFRNDHFATGNYSSEYKTNLFRDMITDLGRDPDGVMYWYTSLTAVATSDTTGDEYAESGKVFRSYATGQYGSLEAAQDLGLEAYGWARVSFTAQWDDIVTDLTDILESRDVTSMPWDEVDAIIADYREIIDGEQKAGDARDNNLKGTAGNDVLTGLEGDDVITGRADEDVIYGGKGDDDLRGGADADVIFGGNGADVLKGGQGKDALYGGSGHDTIEGQDGADQMSGGGGDDVMFGGKGADVMAGQGGKDTLDGGDGRDILIGGAKNDQLTGGNGRDTFVFDDTSGRDHITDFDVDKDMLMFSDVELAEIGHRTVEDRTFLTWGDDNRVVLQGVEVALEDIDIAFI